MPIHDGVEYVLLGGLTSFHCFWEFVSSIRVTTIPASQSFLYINKETKKRTNSFLKFFCFDNGKEVEHNIHNLQFPPVTLLYVTTCLCLKVYPTAEI